jgi:hypothetical protein
MSEEKYEEQVDEKSDISVTIEEKIPISIDYEGKRASDYDYNYKQACMDDRLYNYPESKERVLRFQKYMRRGEFTSYGKEGNNKSYNPILFIQSDRTDNYDGLSDLMDNICAAITDIWQYMIGKTDKQIRLLKSHFENKQDGKEQNVFQIHIAWRIISELEEGIINRDSIMEKLTNFKWMFLHGQDAFQLRDINSKHGKIKSYNSAFIYSQMMRDIENQNYTQCKFLDESRDIPKYIDFEDFNRCISDIIQKKNLGDISMNMDDKIFTTIRAKNKLAMAGIIVVCLFQSFNIGFEVCSYVNNNKRNNTDLTKIVLNVIALMLFFVFSCISMNISSVNDYDAAYAEYISDDWSEFSDVTLLMFDKLDSYCCKIRKIVASLFLCGGHRFICSRHPTKCC